MDEYLTSREAADLLGVRVETLYAYVSRGQLRSRPGPDPRSRRYRRAEVVELAERREQRRRPERAAARALDWGRPVLQSSLTLIDGGRFYYRGRDAVELAETESLERVAALLWTGSLEASSELFSGRIAPLSERERRQIEAMAGAHPSEALLAVLRCCAASDASAWDRSPERSLAVGARLLERMIAAAAGLERSFEGSLTRVLCRGLVPAKPELEPVVRAALVLCADHELNVSSFTARCVASAGTPLYDAVSAGLCALRGFRHGGHSDRVEALLLELGIAREDATEPLSVPTVGELGARLRRRLERGERLPGFGQPLYPEGDPRYRALFGMLEARAGRSGGATAERVEAVHAVTEQALELVGLHPTLDFGLALVSAELGRLPGGAFILFALGRTVGWIAHALEETERDRLIRPRAEYVGPLPARTGSERG